MHFDRKEKKVYNSPIKIQGMTMKYILTKMVLLATALMFSGCSAAGVVLGMDSNSYKIGLDYSDLEISKIEEKFFDRDKSYVILIVDNKKNHPQLIEKTEKGFEIKASIDDIPGRAIVEVEAGLHEFVDSSNCSISSIKVDVKKGYIYYLRNIGGNNLSLMDYCGGESYFSPIMGVIPEETYKDFPNYTLIEGDVSKANQIIKDSSLPKRYAEYSKTLKTDIEAIHPFLRTAFNQKYAVKIK